MSVRLWVRPLRRILAGSILASALVLSSLGAAGAACSVSSTPVNFGTYDAASLTPNTSNGTVTVTCFLLALLFTVDLSRGSSASYSPRKMLSGANSLNYNLYFDSAYTTVWGDNTSGTTHWAPVLALLSASTTVYGRIPAQQNVPAGSYNDSLITTVTF